MSAEESSLPSDDLFKPDFGDLSEEIQQIAYHAIGETPKRRKDALKKLRALIKERGDVQPTREDDAFFIRFLRARLFKVDQAYQLMVNYYNFRKSNPKFFKDVDPTKNAILNIFKEDIGIFLPYRDQVGRRMVVYKIKKWDPSVTRVNDILRATLLLLELSLLEQRTQIHGAVCIFDLEGLSLAHVRQIMPRVAQNSLQLLGLGFPVRLKEVHIVNQPRIFDTIIGLFMPFLDQKMRARLHLHGRNFETLHSFIGPMYLPAEYGGVRRPFNFNECIENMIAIPRIIEELNSVGYMVNAQVTPEDILT